MQLDEGVTFELLFIGNELLIGKVLNTNSNWLTHQITQLGGFCTRITIIRDDLEEISKVVREILTRSPRFLIISGGLGPTYDDMTLEGLSKALKKPLQLDKTALSWVTKKYQEFHREKIATFSEMTPEREKMAQLPISARPLFNSAGAAPGVLIEEELTMIVCLPGVPNELKAIFEESVKKVIVEEIGDRCFVESSFTVTGLGESAMAPTIREVKEQYSPYVYVKSHPKQGSDVPVEFHLTTPGNVECQGKDHKFLEQKIEDAQKTLEDKLTKLGGKIYHHPQKA